MQLNNMEAHRPVMAPHNCHESELEEILQQQAASTQRSQSGVRKTYTWRRGPLTEGLPDGWTVPQETAKNTAKKGKSRSSLHVMKSKPREFRLSSTINMSENAKFSNADNTGMNCCDSWRHISDIVNLKGVRVKQTFLPDLCVTPSSDLQMDYCQFNSSSSRRQTSHLIYSAHLFNIINSIWPSSVCFCCKAACFLQFGLMSCSSPTVELNLSPWGLRTGSGGSQRQKQKRKRQVHLELGHYSDAGVLGVRGRGWGFSVGHGGQHRTGFACFSAVPQNTQLRGPLRPRNTTPWRWSPTPLNDCTCPRSDQNSITKTKSCFSKWWPFCSGSVECSSMRGGSHTAYGESCFLRKPWNQKLVCERYRFSRLVRNEMDAQDYCVLAFLGENLALMCV